MARVLMRYLKAAEIRLPDTKFVEEVDGASSFNGSVKNMVVRLKHSYSYSWDAVSCIPVEYACFERLH